MAEEKKKEQERKAAEKKATAQRKTTPAMKGGRKGGERKPVAAKKAQPTQTPSVAPHTSSWNTKPTHRKLESEFVSPDEESSDESEENESENSNEDEEACFKCGSHTPPESSTEDGEDEDVAWYQCDNVNCECWYHVTCLNEPQLTSSDSWDCPICVLNKE